MTFQTKENKRFREHYLHTKLDSGFSVTVVPKKFKSSVAMICCDFGGGDIKYEKNGEIRTLPAGTAHFLEHKIFERPDGSDAFGEFDSFGGNANAYTSFENTCYYFSCTENFFENLEILLSAVSELSVTKRSVDKERKIIAREITMYEDSPSSRLTRALNRSLYHSHPIVNPIAGTVESISEITKATLAQAFSDFYVPANMALCVCGDVDESRVLDMAKRYFGEQKGGRPKTLYGDEPRTVFRSNHTESASVATPLYAIGIKCTPYSENNLEAQRRGTAMRLAMSLMFGRASSFFCENYAKSLLNERFFAGYLQSKGSAHILVTGSGNDCDAVKDKVVAEIERRKHIGFEESQILREKKAAYAESIALYDSCEDIVSVMAPSAFLDYDEFDCIELIRDITPEEILDAVKSIDTTGFSTVIIERS